MPVSKQIRNFMHFSFMSYSTYVSPEDGRLKRSKHVFIKLKKLSCVNCFLHNC
jgi:hypothetical protein